MVSSLTDFASRLRSEKVQPFLQTEGSLREVHDTLTEMMKQLANEPSVGLYFVQQHVHKAVPGMVSLKTQMVDTTLEVEYVTQDVKDALNSVKSMKEVGPAVIERMIKTMDSSQPLLASLRPAKRVSSEQVPLEKQISGLSTSAGDYSGYMRTTFDSALQKASSIANVTKWNSFNRGTNLESSSSAGGQNLGSDIKLEAPSESNPSLGTQDVLGAAYGRASSLKKTVSEPTTGISINKETVSTAQEGQEVRDFSDPSMGKTHSLPPLREISDYGKPGQYVRAVLGSARQTAENVSREASKFLSPDVKKPVSASDKPGQGWGWLPSKALRAFNKQSQTSEDLIAQEGSGDTVILDEPSSSSRSEEEIQQLLEIERASYEAFAAEKAAQLEEWLQDTEEDDKKTEIA
ncbi:unnamed protein product [Calypogeia fissa]